MYRRILIVPDRHREAGDALRDGAWLATGRGSEVTLFAAVRSRRADGESRDDATTATAITGDGLRADRVPALARVLPAIRRGHKRVAGVIGECQRRQCDVIVVPSPDRHAWLRLLTGHLLPGLISATPCPLWVCRPGAGPSAAGHAGLHSLLLVVEGRTGSRAAVAEAVALARSHGAGLWLAAGPSPGEDGAEVLAALMHEAAGAARHAGVPVQRVDALPYPSAAAVCELAARLGCELIVLGIAPGSALRRILGGSLVPRVVSASPVPVLLVPDGAKGSPRRIRRHRSARAAR